MTVAQYDSRFVDLARHALLLLPTEGERVRRFIEGLTHPIRLQMAKETGSEISFQAAANVARRIEMVLAQERGQRSDKRPRQFGGFGAASYGGRGTYGRVQVPRGGGQTVIGGGKAGRRRPRGGDPSVVIFVLWYGGGRYIRWCCYGYDLDLK